jgi:hypothetical protein
MEAPDRRSSSAVSITLIACGIGWFVLPNTPGYMAGESPDRLALLQQFFTWWPLALIAAFAIGLVLPKTTANSAPRWALLILQWLLTFASVALIVATLFEVFFPRPH